MESWFSRKKVIVCLTLFIPNIILATQESFIGGVLANAERVEGQLNSELIGNSFQDLKLNDTTNIGLHRHSHINSEFKNVRVKRAVKKIKHSNHFPKSHEKSNKEFSYKNPQIRKKKHARHPAHLDLIKQFHTLEETHEHVYESSEQDPENTGSERYEHKEEPSLDTDDEQSAVSNSNKQQESAKKIKTIERVKIRHHHHHHHHNHIKEAIKKVPVEKLVHVPIEKVVEKIVHVPKVIEKLVEKKIKYPFEKIVERKVPYPVEKIVETKVPYPVKKIVERKVPYPVPVEKIVEKIIHVPVEKMVPMPVEKIIEKVVYVPKYIPNIVEKIVEKMIHVPVEKIVVKHVPVPVKVKVPVYVEKPVPFPIIKKVPVPYQVPVEKKIPVYMHFHKPYKISNSDYYSAHEKPDDNSKLEEPKNHLYGERQQEGNLKPFASNLNFEQFNLMKDSHTEYDSVPSPDIDEIRKRRKPVDYFSEPKEQIAESQQDAAALAPDESLTPLRIHVKDDEPPMLDSPLLNFHQQPTKDIIPMFTNLTTLHFPFRLIRLHPMPFQLPLGSSPPITTSELST